MGTLVGYLQVNRICNHNCIYCSNPSNKKVFSYEEIIKGLENLKNSGYTDVILTGGEPTLHKDFLKIVKKARELGIKPRLITNGSKISDYDFAKQVVDAGIELIHLSVYTSKQELNDYIRKTEGSFKQMVKTMMNLRKLGIETQVTTVISSFNQNDLYKTVLFIKKIFPEIKHFVWNVIDPLMMIKSEESLKSIPDINTIKDELRKVFSYLEKNGSSFRIERIPLCLIPRGYEFANTEVRKIVKQQSRKVIFLDERNIVDQKPQAFQHDFVEECDSCVLRDICGGIRMYDEYSFNVKVKPYTDKNIKQEIINDILDGR